MKKIITTTGKEIEIIRASRGGRFPILHIYTNSISVGDAWTIFNDREETKVLREVDDEFPEEIKVYEDYTELTSVQKALMEEVENAIMIRLEKPNVLLIKPELPPLTEIDKESNNN